jgi:hypothetical protein
MAVISHTLPTLDTDYLELVVVVDGNCEGLFRGSFVLFSHDDEAMIQVSGIVVSE